MEVLLAERTLVFVRHACHLDVIVSADTLEKILINAAMALTVVSQKVQPTKKC